MIWALIPAAGQGRRMEPQALSTSKTIPKQYHALSGRTVLEHSLSPFIENAAVDGVVVALAADDSHWPRLALSRHQKISTVTGGAERANSVLAGLEFLKQQGNDSDWVLIHDAARPCLRVEELEGLMKAVSGDQVGGILALPSRDTLKQEERGRSVTSIDRSRIWQAQTPQMFRLGLLHDALTTAIKTGRPVTDEASALEFAGHRPMLVEGRADNLKITVAEDLVMAELILNQRKSRGENTC